MTDKKYTFSEKELAEAISKIWQEQVPIETKKLARDICRTIDNPPPPTLGPDYLGKMAREKYDTFAYHIRRNITTYLGGLIEGAKKAEVTEAINNQWYMGFMVACEKIRTALCGEKKDE